MLRTTLVTAVGKTLAATLLTGSALVAGAGVLASPATADDGGPTACQQVWDALPAAMQADIKAALGLPPRQRQHALLAIHYAALNGHYGDQVQTWAKKLQAKRAEVWAKLPAQLKADVRAARSLGFHEQRRAMAAIRVAALKGVYGDYAQQVAQARQKFFQGCPDAASALAAAASDPLS